MGRNHVSRKLTFERKPLLVNVRAVCTSEGLFSISPCLGEMTVHIRLILVHLQRGL